MACAVGASAPSASARLSGGAIHSLCAVPVRESSVDRRAESRVRMGAGRVGALEGALAEELSVRGDRSPNSPPYRDAGSIPRPGIGTLQTGHLVSARVIATSQRCQVAFPHGDRHLAQRAVALAGRARRLAETEAALPGPRPATRGAGSPRWRSRIGTLPRRQTAWPATMRDSQRRQSPFPTSAHRLTETTDGGR